MLSIKDMWKYTFFCEFLKKDVAVDDAKYSPELFEKKEQVGIITERKFFKMLVGCSDLMDICMKQEFVLFSYLSLF